MSAFIPSRDAAANTVAFDQVRQDKEREAANGFDGSWVAHPGLVPVCQDAFDAVLGTSAHQIGRVPPAQVAAEDLLAIGKTPGAITRDGLRANLAVAIRYLDCWLSGTGAVAVHGLMEDAATAEISRSQISQWLQHGARLEDGDTVTAELVTSLLTEQFDLVRSDLSRRYAETANSLLAELILTAPPAEFFTTQAYARHLVKAEV
jgi:malate synthase